jgi:hypothetical protein
MATTTDTVRQSSGYHALVGVGLASFGLVHLIIAWIALQVAFTKGGDASQQGALRQLAQQPLGLVLLWAMAVGLLTLTIWQVMEAVVGRSGQRSSRQVRRRISSVGRAVVYLVLAVTAARVASGAGTSSSGQGEETVSARLLSVPFGRLLVAAVGAAVIGVGVSQIVKGLKHKFTEDLSGASSTAIRLGTVGYCAKGVALAIIGLLFGWAAWTYDPKKAGGMDAALSTLRSQPFGSALLTAMAVGIAAFGLYCFYWARHAKY